MSRLLSCHVPLLAVPVAVVHMCHSYSPECSMTWEPSGFRKRREAPSRASVLIPSLTHRVSTRRGTFIFTHGSGLRPWAPGHSVCVSLSSTPPLEQMQDAKCKACFTLTRKIGGSALRVEHALGGITPLPPRGGLTPWFVCPSAVRREVVLPGSQGLGHLGSVLHRHCGWHCSVLCLVQRCRQCPAQIPSSSC